MFSNSCVDLIPIKKIQNSIKSEPELVLNSDDSDDFDSSDAGKLMNGNSYQTMVNGFVPEEIEVEPELVVLDEDDDDATSYYNHDSNAYRNLNDNDDGA